MSEAIEFQRSYTPSYRVDYGREHDAGSNRTRRSQPSRSRRRKAAFNGMHRRRNKRVVW